MVPRPQVEESEALNRAAFDSLGQKQRAFESLCLSYSSGFRTTLPSLGLNESVYDIKVFQKG
jgi:hypothetical protein